MSGYLSFVLSCEKCNFSNSKGFLESRDPELDKTFEAVIDFYFQELEFSWLNFWKADDFICYKVAIEF